MKIKVIAIDKLSKIIAIFIGIAFCIVVMRVTVEKLNLEAGVEILLGIVMVFILLPIGVALAFAPVARKRGKICRVATGILMLPTFVSFLGLSAKLFNSPVLAIMSLFIMILYIIQYYLLFEDKDKEVIEVQYSKWKVWIEEIGLWVGLFILFILLIFGIQLTKEMSLKFKIIAIFMSVISILAIINIGRSRKMKLIDWITKITAFALAFDTAGILAVVNTASDVSDEDSKLGIVISSIILMSMLQIGLFLAPTLRQKSMRWKLGCAILMLPGFALSFIAWIFEGFMNFLLILNDFAGKAAEKNVQSMGKIMIYNLGIMVYLIQYWLLLKDILWKDIYLLSLLFKKICGRIKTFQI